MTSEDAERGGGSRGLQGEHLEQEAALDNDGSDGAVARAVEVADPAAGGQGVLRHVVMGVCEVTVVYEEALANLARGNGPALMRAVFVSWSGGCRSRAGEHAAGRGCARAVVGSENARAEYEEERIQSAEALS